jgi:hypothetical protein
MGKRKGEGTRWWGGGGEGNSYGLREGWESEKVKREVTDPGILDYQ